MHLVLAGLGALIVGAGDFVGGTATRRDVAHAVATLSFLAGALFLGALTPLVGGVPIGTDFVWGALSGLGGAIGVLALYRGFARSAMGVVSPVAAVVMAAVPVVGALLMGEAPGPIVVIGLVMGLVAIVMVSAGPSVDDIEKAARVSGVRHGLVTGVGFGVQLLALALVTPGAGMLPVMTSRFVSFVLLAAVAFTLRQTVLPQAKVRPLAAVGGMLTGGGVALYYLAVSVGSIVASTAVYALFPVSTVLMARIVHKERLSRQQILGVALAVAAGALLGAVSVA